MIPRPARARTAPRLGCGLAGPLLVSALAGFFLALAAPAVSAQEAWRVLRGMPRVALAISMDPDHPLVSVEDLERRAEDALRQNRPALAIDPASPDRLHILIGVRSVNASELRGFYLPFSGDYGIGPVRLSIERPATIRGFLAPVPVVVWQAFRQVKAPWHRSGREVLALVDDLVADFLEDYSRAAAP
jgi:hypothetical protein